MLKKMLIIVSIILASTSTSFGASKILNTNHSYSSFPDTSHLGQYYIFCQGPYEDKWVYIFDGTFSDGTPLFCTISGTEVTIPKSDSYYTYNYTNTNGLSSSPAYNNAFHNSTTLGNCVSTNIPTDEELNNPTPPNTDPNNSFSISGLLTGIKSLIIPTSDDVNTAFKNFYNDIKLKFNVDTDFLNVSDETYEFDDVVESMLFDFGSISGVGNFKFVDSKPIKSAVDKFRPYLSSFMLLLLALYNYNQVLSLFGGARISSLGSKGGDD